MGHEDVSVFDSSHTLYSRVSKSKAFSAIVSLVSLSRRGSCVKEPLGVSAMQCPVHGRFSKPLLIQFVDALKSAVRKIKP